MSDETLPTADDPVSGDGVVTVPVPSAEDCTMAEAIDLPSNVAAQLMAESVTNGLANSQNARNVSTAALGVLQAAMARNFDEIGIAESRGSSGLIATPIASPTTQAGG